ALALAGFWNRKRRPLFVAFGLYAAVAFVLGLNAVAAHAPAALRSFRLADLYLHKPQWFGYGLLLAVAVLGALGLEGFVEARSNRERVAMAIPGVVIWGALPLAFGAHPGTLWPA